MEKKSNPFPATENQTGKNGQKKKNFFKKLGFFFSGPVEKKV